MAGLASVIGLLIGHLSAIAVALWDAACYRAAVGRWCTWCADCLQTGPNTPCHDHAQQDLVAEVYTTVLYAMAG